MSSNHSHPRTGARLHLAVRQGSNSSEQERGLRRGNPVRRRASPSPSRRLPKPHRQLSREHYIHSRPHAVAMPDYRRFLKSGKTSRVHQQPEYTTSRRSEDSDSSASSGSLFASTLVRDEAHFQPPGYASSCTSLEEEEEEEEEDPKRGRQSPEIRTIRGRRTKQSHGPRGDHRHDVVSSSPEDGYSVWNRVATAASMLTVSVSKAWAANATNAGEDTPPGEESRLHRAMKAYHLDKATDPTHLPSWLFTEHERRPVGQLRLANQHDNDDGIADVLSSPLSPSRGLRAHASPISPRSPADMPTSKAAAHLKALRDAKRNILTNVTSPTEESASDRDEAQRRRAQRRMGMSVGPEKYGRF